MAAPPPDLASLRIGPWQAAAATRQGRERPENQDAFHLSARGIAVFDGVGGRPNGRAAADAAAAALQRAAAWSEDLAPLDAAVRATGGCATAAVVRLGDAGAVQVVTAGDSPVFLVRDDVATPLTPSDGRDAGIVQGLGFGSLRPHVAALRPVHADVIVVCSDGVAAVVPSADLELLALGAPEKAVLRILDEVAARKGRDDATVIVARYVAPKP